MKQKKVCVVITARASYSRIKTALLALKAHEEIDLQIVVAASAMIDRFGSAIEVIEKDGFHIDARVYNIVESNSLTGQAKTTGLGIIELSTVFDNLKPDCALTIADRYETMATAIAASYLNIPLVHIQGGEVTGNIDEKVRHAITKLADLHLVSTSKARERVIKMGENPQMVFNTGCPSIDLAKLVYEKDQPLFSVYDQYGGVGNKPSYEDGYVIVMQHPVTSEFELSRSHIEITLEAIHSLKRPTFWFWPNVDGGTDGTSKGIRIFRETNDNHQIHFFKNMTPEDFLSLLKHADCIVGNSSVGIRESSYMGVPSVDIGSRQGGREKGKNVMEVAYDVQKIKEAVSDQIKHSHYQSEHIYGDGEAGSKIADLIASTQISFSKKLMY